MARLSEDTSNLQHLAEQNPVRITPRTPTPLDPGLPSLAQLPDDAVLLILTFVDFSDLLAVATISSALYEQARRVQHHTVHIDLTRHDQAWSRLDVLAINLMLPTVHVLEVTGYSITTTGEEVEKILSRLADMLPGMAGLRDLHWHIPIPLRTECCWQMPPPIPRSILNCIPTRTRLHTSVAAMNEPHDQARAFLARLVDNQNLFSLSAHVAIVDEHKCRATMHILKQVLLSCPRLSRIPTLYVGPVVSDHHGVMYGPGPMAPYCGLGLSGNERPPALEEFGLTCYPWGWEPTPYHLAIQRIYCAGYPEKGGELQYWVEKFDWSHLRRLNYIPFDLAFEMVPKLTALKEFVFEEIIDRRWEDKELSTFLDQIPTTLELLSIPSWCHINKQPGPLIRHGEAMRSLTIHSFEPWTENSLVTDADLVTLRDGLPHIEKLALDIARDNTRNAWPFSTLDIIAGFSCLQSLQLWFELKGGLPMPHVTVFAARQLLTYLRARNKEILRLELCSGAPSRKRSGFGVPRGPSWASQNSIRLLCEVSLRDVDAADGFLRVTCPALSSKLNEELNRRAKETREGKRGVAEDAKRLLLEIALDGPLTKDDWIAWKQLTWVRWEARQKAQLPEPPPLQHRSVFKKLVSSVFRCK